MEDHWEDHPAICEVLAFLEPSECMKMLGFCMFLPSRCGRNRVFCPKNGVFLLLQMRLFGVLPDEASGTEIAGFGGLACALGRRLLAQLKLRLMTADASCSLDQLRFHVMLAVLGLRLERGVIHGVFLHSARTRTRFLACHGANGACSRSESSVQRALCLVVRAHLYILKSCLDRTW